MSVERSGQAIGVEALRVNWQQEEPAGLTEGGSSEQMARAG
jgi:hypothetical protein